MEDTNAPNANPHDTNGVSAPAKPAPNKKPRGFAAIDKSLVREIARKGGKAAHAAGTAHEFTHDEAREAGKKGGRASHAKRKAAAGNDGGGSNSAPST